MTITTFDIKREGDGAFLIHREMQAGILFKEWQRLDMFATTLQRMARHIYTEERIQHSPNLFLHHLIDTHQMLIEFAGKAFAYIPCHFAIEVSHALKAMARKIEEEKVAEQVIRDQAMMFRDGTLPFTLSSNPAIIQEAVKEAQHNPELRRYMPHRADVFRFGRLVVHKEKPHVP